MAAMAMNEPKTPRKQRINHEDIMSFTPAQRAKKDAAPLSNYTLGDCLGKGAFATVYRALNLGTGETVAVKQIRLIDVPKADLDTIMLEIDLLKNLNHPNIVKYHGFVKTANTLSIILEYCENGSLTSICKKFGKFPENLVAVYIFQVLQGLAYLHQQGAIHRDIKGANILTTKDGLAKLADFGVATRINKIVGDQSVVGTPNWMAPEVIELNGATTASDIWSLGCTIVELLTGKPPYHHLRQMPALFAIVNDDHPPIPDGLSPQVQDFLLQCFQKDPNLRVTAKKLLKHPWMLAVANSESSKKLATAKYDDAVKSVQQWNDAIQKPVEISPTVRPRKKKSLTQYDLKKYSEDYDNNNKDSTKQQLFVQKGRSRNIRSQSSASNGSNENEKDGWNTKRNTSKNYGDYYSSSTSKSDDSNGNGDPFTSMRLFSQSKRLQLRNMLNSSTSKNNSENWDSDFEDDIPASIEPVNLRRRGNKNESSSPDSKSIGSPQTPHTPRRNHRPELILGKDSPYRDDTEEDYSDLEGVVNVEKLKPSLQPRRSNFPQVLKPSDLISLSRDSDHVLPSQTEPVQPITGIESSTKALEYFTETDEDNDDYSSVFGDGFNSSNESMVLQARQPPSVSSADSSIDEAAFATEESFNTDLATNAARDRIARAQVHTQALVESLNNDLSFDDLAKTCQDLLELLLEYPDTKRTVIRSHGLLPLLEQLDRNADTGIVLNLLKCLKEILDETNFENFAMIGGIPTVTKFASRKYSTEIRLQAAHLVRLMCETRQDLQMLISCGGLTVLSQFVEEDIRSQRELVSVGIDGLRDVFQLDSAPRNDICRILARNSILDSMVQVLIFAVRAKELQLIETAISIFHIFSQTETHVKESIANRTLFRGLFKCYYRLEEEHQLTVLKFIKNLTVPANFTTLQNSNAIEMLVDILNESRSHSTKYKEIANQVLHVMFNLCRLSPSRQEEAALCGLVPILQEVVAGDMPMKQFALPILCDMAHAGKNCRKILWGHNGLETYLFLLSDPYWQVNAYEAIAAWLVDEQARVEETLMSPANSQRLLSGLDEAKSNTLNTLLEPLINMLRTSTRLCRCLPLKQLFQQIKRRLKNSKPIVRLNLLRLVRAALDADRSKGHVLDETGLSEVVSKLTTIENPVLVRELAKDLLTFTGSSQLAPFLSSTRSSSSSSSTSKPAKKAYAPRPTAVTRNTSFKLPYEDSTPAALQSPKRHGYSTSMGSPKNSPEKRR